MSQSVFASLYKHWAWIAIPVMLAAVTALVFLILGVIATVKHAHLFKVTLARSQVVEFTGAGRVVLSMEGPRGSTRFARVDFELKGIDGDPVEGRRALFRARTSGISTVRMELLKFNIPRASTC